MHFVNELSFRGKDRYRPDRYQMSLVGLLLVAEGAAAVVQLGVVGFCWLAGGTTALVGLVTIAG